MVIPPFADVPGILESKTSSMVDLTKVTTVLVTLLNGTRRHLQLAVFSELSEPTVLLLIWSPPLMAG